MREQHDPRVVRGSPRRTSALDAHGAEGWKTQARMATPTPRGHAGETGGIGIHSNRADASRRLPQTTRLPTAAPINATAPLPDDQRAICPDWGQAPGGAQLSSSLRAPVGDHQYNDCGEHDGDSGERASSVQGEDAAA